MNRASDPPAEAAPEARGGHWVVFTPAGERFAVPAASVDRIAAPPPLAALPYAAPAVLGAGKLGGRIVPIVDLAVLLGRERGPAAYDGGGEIVRLQSDGGSIGLWVDRAERLVSGGTAGNPDGAMVIDPMPLVAAALAPPVLAAGQSAPLAEVAERVAPAPPMTAVETVILVEAAGRPIALRRESLVELLDAVGWTRMPRAPAGFRGIAVLRGAALPVLSLAALLGLGEPGEPRGFAAIELNGRRALLAVDRIVGLRMAGENEAPIDPGALLPDELRRIVLGFAPIDEARPPHTAAPADAAITHLAFAVAGQECAVPIACVERVVGAQRLIRLPRPANGAGGPPLDGAIEVHGQIVPVAALRSRLGRDGEPADAAAPSAFVILRDGDGVGAIGVDLIRRVVALRPHDIVPSPADEDGPIAAVAAPPGGAVLRIIAPQRLWSGR